jgi:X-domain of DnaJ-containing
MKDLMHTMDVSMKESEGEVDENGEPIDPELAAAMKLSKEEAEAREAGEKTTPGATTPIPATGGAAAGASTGATAAGPTAPSKAPAFSSYSEETLVPESAAGSTHGGTSSPSTAPRRGIPTQRVIMDKSEEEARLEAAGLTEEEKKLRKEEKKKGGLSKEQREQLYAYELERKRVRDERVNNLTQKLIDRISVWTETDKDKDTTRAFEAKTKYDVDNLVMESFGLEILNAVGGTYIQKASTFLKSQKFLGISGFFSRIANKGTQAKETWNTISSVFDAQTTIEEMARMEKEGGADWTDEKKAEFERRVTGKILAAAWKGSRMEIQSVLREVSDKVLEDKTVPLSKRIERAKAMMIIGHIFQNVSLASKTLFPRIFFARQY